MKLLFGLTTIVTSSHYRGGTYIFKSNGATTAITQTQTWRDGWAGTSGICDASWEGKLARP